MIQRLNSKKCDITENVIKFKDFSSCNTLHYWELTLFYLLINFYFAFLYFN